jgi:pyruvate/2-oxoglutarate dehydrogenase complex dihydrolipoamide acyltransferase (E2) component
MATSSQTLSLIIDELLKASPANRGEALKLLENKNLLPKKLIEDEKKAPVEKKISVFASKIAEEYAAANGIDIPEGFKGTANKDRISVGDLKKLAIKDQKPKMNASPSALKFCRDNGLDITRIQTGSGEEGKILLKDVKDLTEPDPPADSDSETDSKSLKVSPAAAKLMKKYEIDEEDLEDIEATGSNGTITAKDLKPLIDLIKDESSSDEDN